MNVQIDHLFNHDEHRAYIARAIFAEFWADQPEYSPAVFERLLADASSADRIPLSLVALIDSQPAGTINLIDNDDEKRRHLHPWLAALIVFPPYRHHGIGSALVVRLLAEAARLGFEEVYFGTDAPGFYKRLGATYFEQARSDLVIMRCATKAL